MSTSDSPATEPVSATSSSNGAPLLELRGVTKRFGPVQALTRINIEIPPGQVTALAGDNGAGKSVTIKTIAGLWPADEGEIVWEGKPVHFHGPRDAEAVGITTIYQDLALADNLDIVQNMFLGHEPLERGLLDEGKMETTAKQTLEELSVKTIRSIRQPVASLSGGQRQSVAVAKAVMSKAKLVIMDEPTAALGVSQTRTVLTLDQAARVPGRRRSGRLPQLERCVRGRGPCRDPVSGKYGRARSGLGIRPQHGRRLHDHRALVARSRHRGGPPLGRTGGRVMPDEFSSPSVPSEIEEPPLSTELNEDEATPETPADLVTAAPEVLADSLGDYLRAQWRRIKSGESGALPVVAGLIIIIVFFQIERSRFGSALNLVNLFQQASIYILLGAAQIFALILSEIDLSVGSCSRSAGW